MSKPDALKQGRRILNNEAYAASRVMTGRKAPPRAFGRAALNTTMDYGAGLVTTEEV